MAVHRRAGQSATRAHFARGKAHMLRTSAAALASHHFQSILENPEFDIFYHAPALIVISAAAGPWIVEDCALAAENLMLAACAAGLGTCWIGFAQEWLGTPEGKSSLKRPCQSRLLSWGIPRRRQRRFPERFRRLTGFRSPSNAPQAITPARRSRENGLAADVLARTAHNFSHIHGHFFRRYGAVGDHPCNQMIPKS